MQNVIEHPTVRATRTEMLLEDNSRMYILHVDTKLVLTPDAPYYSEHAVSGLIQLVDEYRRRHSISEVILHQCD